MRSPVGTQALDGAALQQPRRLKSWDLKTARAYEPSRKGWLAVLTAVADRPSRGLKSAERYVHMRLCSNAAAAWSAWSRRKPNVTGSRKNQAVFALEFRTDFSYFAALFFCRGSPRLHSAFAF